MLDLCNLCCIRLAVNVNSNQEPSWRDNFFERVHVIWTILVWTFIFSLSGFDMIQLNYDLIVPIFFVVTSVLLMINFKLFI